MHPNRPFLGAAASIQLDDDQVTDDAGVLSADEEQDVNAALDELRSEDGVQLFVVYVDSFDGADPQEWTEAAAAANGLGANDVLLAIAVEDRQYWNSADESLSDTLSPELEEDVLTGDAEPLWGDGDWAGGTIAAANGFRAGIGESTAPSESGSGDGGSGNDDGGGGGWFVPLLIIAALAAGGWALMRRRRQMISAAGGGATEGQPPAPPAPVDPLDALSDDDLATKGSALLVEVDDAIKTSEVDLNVAEVEFGAAAVTPYRTALATAGQEVKAAFEARMTLTDELAADARRQVLRQVYERAQKADGILDDQAEAFAELRDRANRAGEIVANLEPQLATAGQRLPAAEAQLQRLKATYPVTALGDVADNDTEARERVAFAAERLTAAKAAITGGDPNASAVASRAAEEALAQVTILLDAVDRAAADLEQARGRLATRVDGIRRLIAEADAGAEPGPEVVSAAVAATQLLADIAPRVDDPTLDPVAAVQRLEEAEAGLVAALAPARKQRAAADEARAELDETVTRAQNRITAVEDYVTTRRGGIGVDARTRIASARQLLDEARRIAGDDPVTALATARQALSTADAAAKLAEADVDDYRQSPYDGDDRGDQGGLGGMVLGGILLDSILRGPRGGGYRGGIFGGGGGGGSRNRGGGGGSRRSGGASPGRFGGSSGRRGTGGRF